MDEDRSEAEVVKVCLVGDSCVGKSSISIRFARNTFYPNMLPTLGVAYLSKVMSGLKEKKYKFQLWDTAGQERYRSLVPIYYHGASVILVVFDVTNRDSLVAGAGQWLKELRREGPADALYALIGNKADLGERDREVGAEEARLWASNLGIMYYEVSAKSGFNVTELFEDICLLLDNRLIFTASTGLSPNRSADTSGRKSANKTETSIDAQLSIKGKIETFKLRFSGENSSRTNCCGQLCETS